MQLQMKKLVPDHNKFCFMICLMVTTIKSIFFSKSNNYSLFLTINDTILIEKLFLMIILYLGLIAKLLSLIEW